MEKKGWWGNHRGRRKKFDLSEGTRIVSATRKRKEIVHQTVESRPNGKMSKEDGLPKEKVPKEENLRRSSQKRKGEKKAR